MLCASNGTGCATDNKANLIQIKQKMTKVHYIARVEVGYRPHSHWEEKEFDERWKAVKYVDEHRRTHLNGGYVEERIEKPAYDPDLDRAMRTVNKYVDRMFKNSRNGRLF